MQPEPAGLWNAVRIVGAVLLALIAGLAFLYGTLSLLEWLSGDTPREGSGSYTETEKLQLLKELRGTSSVSESEKKELLGEMKEEVELSEQEKMDILRSLRAQ